MSQELTTQIDAKELQQQIVALAQDISNTCDGHIMMVVQGALGHLLAQLIMRASAGDLKETDELIDALARAMKADARLVLEHSNRPGVQ